MIGGYKRYPGLFATLLGLFLGLTAGLAALVNANYVDATLKNKAYLLETRPDVIFAGDSRAQRQLDPRVFSRLDRNLRKAVNVAAESASVLSLDNLVDQYRPVFARATVVVSVSSNQINDGALAGGAYPEAMIARMSLWQQLRTFAPDHLDVLQAYYRRNFKYLRKKMTGRLTARCEDLATLGFKPICSVLDKTSISVDHQLAHNPWLQGWNLDGFKRRLFEPALSALRAKVGRLVIVVGPIAPAFREIMAHTSAIANEQEFDLLLAAFCRDQGISYQCYSFDNRFVDSDFYDPFHLNEEGAEKLTKFLMEDQRL